MKQKFMIVIGLTVWTPGLNSCEIQKAISNAKNNLLGWRLYISVG